MLDSVAFLHHHFQHHSKPAFLSCLPFQNLMLFLCCCKPFCATFFIYLYSFYSGFPNLRKCHVVSLFQPLRTHITNSSCTFTCKVKTFFHFFF